MLTIETLFATRCEIYSNSTIKTPVRRKRCCSEVFIINFEHISHLVLVLLWLVNFEHVITRCVGLAKIYSGKMIYIAKSSFNQIIKTLIRIRLSTKGGTRTFRCKQGYQGLILGSARYYQKKSFWSLFFWKRIIKFLTRSLFNPVWPITARCCLSIWPENIIKPVFWCFQGV